MNCIPDEFDKVSFIIGKDTFSDNHVDKPNRKE